MLGVRCGFRTSCSRLRSLPLATVRIPAGAVMPLSRRWCADSSHWRESLKRLGIAVGPAALNKLIELWKMSKQAKEIWPARVKLDFVSDSGTVKDTLPWRPREQYLHEVFAKYNTNIYDFNLKYTDRDGEEMVLDPSMSGIEDMMETTSGGSVRIKVTWRPPSKQESVELAAGRTARFAVDKVADVIKKAKQWIAGDGTVSSEQVKEAEKDVQSAGGTIVPSERKEVLVQYQGVDLDKWSTVCQTIQNKLSLADDEAAILKDAEFTDEIKLREFHDKPHGHGLSTRMVAFRTVRDLDAKRIHIVYGRHEEYMEVSSQTASIPLNNCIKLGDRTFTVLPPASPHFTTPGKEMINNPFDIPAGWRAVETEEDPGTLVRDIIAPYYWGANRIVFKHGDSWSAFFTSCQGSYRGERVAENMDWFQPGVSGRGLLFTGAASGRLLIEQVPQASTPLINNWKRYVQLRAEEDWGARLGIAG